MLHPLEQLKLQALDMLEQFELQLLDSLEQLEPRAQGGFRNLFYCHRAPVPGAGGAGEMLNCCCTRSSGWSSPCSACSSSASSSSSMELGAVGTEPPPIFCPWGSLFRLLFAPPLGSGTWREGQQPELQALDMLEQFELQLLDPLEQLELRAQGGFRNLFCCLRAPAPRRRGSWEMLNCCCTRSSGWSPPRSACSSSLSSSSSTRLSTWSSARRWASAIYFIVSAHPSLAQGELWDAQQLLHPLERLEPPVLRMLEQLELQLLDPLEQLELDFGDRAAA